MPDKKLCPMEAERSYRVFNYLVRIGWLDYGNFLEIYGFGQMSSLPNLHRIDDFGNRLTYSFEKVVNQSATFSLMSKSSDTRVVSDEWQREVWPVMNYLNLPMVSRDKWREIIALYYDFLSAAEVEQKAEEENRQCKFHILLDRFDESGKSIERRLVYSLREELAARYFLRQDCIDQINRWERKNNFELGWESVFAKAIDIVELQEESASCRIKIRVRFPHARKKKPFVQEWHWHISRTLPLVQGDSQVAAPEEREDERWNFRPGDPKLLRETGSGFYGSYPMFEGDDEPEFRDES